MSCCRFLEAIAALIFACAIAYGEDRPAQGEPGLTPQNLVGTYRVVSGEKSGERIPDERLRGGLVRFTKDTIVATDQNTKELYAATYKLDAAKKPAIITMTSTMDKTKDVTVQGLIQLEGKTLKLIYALPDEGKRPTEFKTHSGQLMVILEKIEK